MRSNKVFKVRFLQGLLLLFLCSCGLEERREYYPSGELKKVYHVEDGKQEGMYKEYHKNGEIKYKGLLKDGEKVGKHYWYYEDGSKKEVAYYENGEEEGEVKEFYKSGEIKFIGHYQNGYNHGLTKFFYKDGSLKDSSFYRNGKREGYSKSFYRNGNTKTLAQWRRDSLLFYKKFSKTGEVKDVFRTLWVHAPDTTAFGDTFRARIRLGGVRDTTLKVRYTLTLLEEKEPQERSPDGEMEIDTLELVDGKGVFEYHHDSTRYRYLHLKVRCEYNGESYTFLMEGVRDLLKPRSSEKGKAS